ncbi:Cthe_2314 family HEPN domain-containing protein [Paenibacillus kobensis]|uniref:Cthe_2314 family HEPN domain-containing protein n=1 Tax=Paenibacillus kobensis TaxID=59841 RepID=UPI000FD9A1D9|nr:Cthe_2314 family HEPN domain-containing protein [Paenibacillus kobensis]
MLRMLFGEPPRMPDGKLAEAIQEMWQFVEIVNQRIRDDSGPERKLRTYEIWTRGIIGSIDEMEQSCYAAEKFAERIHHTAVGAMSYEEQLDYHRYVYYDKNGFIRMFALLDKLGTLLNDVLSLDTERMKPHFSYFTVLRNMRLNRKHPALGNLLDEVKERYKEPMNRLRSRRNVEIHHMNSELQDDLTQMDQQHREDPLLENIAGQVDDLRLGLALVLEALTLSYRYCCERWSAR